MNASPKSLFHTLWVFGSLESWYSRVNKLTETFSGYAFDRIVGPITLVDIVLAATRTLSGSTKILGKFGIIVARISTTSSALRFKFDEVETSESFSAGGCCEVLIE